ncbi:MAG: cysteine desulfurase [Oligoflexales bacterium]|nr:cysteine desulfurase [Oligoflexales bacterium]
MDIENIRNEFPLLGRSIRGKQLIYFDNAATTPKPRQVISKICKYYTDETASVHRGIHYLSQKVTDQYERSREKIARFINAKSPKEIIFTSGATHGINLVARSWGAKFLKEKDEILVSHLDHHSNIVPWQVLCREFGCALKVIPMTPSGELILDDLDNFFRCGKIKLVAVNNVSNALGTINPVKEIIDKAHEHGAVVLVDGAQSLPHISVDVSELGCDFFIFSGHKVFGGTGVGAIYGKKEVLEAMPPFFTGGSMVSSVKFSETEYASLPSKFEAGTPNIAGVLGLGAAIDFVESVGYAAIQSHEKRLTEYILERLSEIKGLTLVGTAKNRVPIFSFTLEGVHPHDIGTILDQDGIAIRVGHHCCQPIMEFFGIAATARISLSLYNTVEEIDQFCISLEKVRDVFP